MNLEEVIDYRAMANSTIKMMFIAFLAASSLFFKIYLDQKKEITQLHLKLQNQDILLISNDRSTGRLNSISDSDVMEEAEYLTSTLTNISPFTIKENFNRIAKKMLPEIRLNFLKETEKKVNYIVKHKIIETLVHRNLKVTQISPLTYRFVANCKINVSVNTINSGTRLEVIEAVITVRRPTKGQLWAFSIISFKRLSKKSYDTLKGATK